MYRHLVSKCFENVVSGHPEMVQWKCFFWTRNILPATLVKWVSFQAALWEYNFCNIECVEVRKVSEIFWAKVYCKLVKWVIFFASFCWFWDFVLENLELKDKIQIWGFESFIFCTKFLIFGGTVLGRIIYTLVVTFFNHGFIQITLVFLIFFFFLFLFFDKMLFIKTNAIKFLLSEDTFSKNTLFH